MGAWTLIVGTLAGFITAFFAEPVKNHFIERSAIANLKKALYRELAHTYVGLKGLLDIVNRDPNYERDRFIIDASSVIRSDCYRYAKSMPVRFYAISEATSIDVIHINLQLVLREEESAVNRIRYAEATREVFESKLRAGDFNLSLLLDVANKVQSDVLKEVTA